jgi:hypothetical protein
MRRECSGGPARAALLGLARGCGLDDDPTLPPDQLDRFVTQTE